MHHIFWFKSKYVVGLIITADIWDKKISLEIKSFKNTLSVKENIFSISFLFFDVIFSIVLLKLFW